MDSEGDPRVLFIMNVTLSFLFSAVVISGLDFVDVIDFSWQTVGLATAGLVILTHLVVLR